MSVHGFLLLFILPFFVAGCADTEEKGGTVVCIIGTQHEPSEIINPDTILSVLRGIAPAAVLCELEREFFTADDRLNIEDHPDLLSTNENIAAHSYQLRTGVPLLSYEVEGRNKYYRDTNYFQDEGRMFQEITDGYTAGTLSPESNREWKIFLDAIPVFDVFGATLREINSPINVQYSEVKNILSYETLVSVTERDLPHWAATAREHRDFWERRNDAMAENILRHCGNYSGGLVVVLCGQQHKAPLVSRLRPNENVVLMDYWEIND